jgi:predicted nucleic acid-binding protein
MLVVDASFAVPASGVEDGFAVLRDDDLYAPPLMWSEARSALHELAWRGQIPTEDARDALGRLGCRVVTLDGRLVRGAGRLGLVVTPSELT